MSCERVRWPVRKLAYYLKGCLTPSELARRCGIPRRTIYRWAEEGRLGYVKIGNKMFVPLDQIVELDHVPATRPVVCRVLQLPPRAGGATGSARDRRAAGGKR